MTAQNQSRPVKNHKKLTYGLVLVVVLIGAGLFWLLNGDQSNGFLNPGLILPIEQLQPPTNSACANGVTAMNIVAHQDDDLLFLSPDLSHHIAAGHCVRTIYVTAGDSGRNSQYWLKRERGAQAAYSLLLGINKNDSWTRKTIKLADHEFVTMASPAGNKRISLIFMRLADGNINGKGFNATNHESLTSLMSNKLATIHAVDGQSTYTSDQLTSALLQLMKNYQPTEINSQAMSDEGHTFHDHSDHLAVGQYASRARNKYINRTGLVPIRFYVGYPIRERPANVSGADLSQKIDAFRAYGQFDGAACRVMTFCGHEPTFWSYLHRQYIAQQ